MLEDTIVELKKRCASLEQENRQLYSRLLQRVNVVPLPEQAPSLEKWDPKSLDSLVAQAPIFGPDEFDGEYAEDELTDNRKGSADAFVS